MKKFLPLLTLLTLLSLLTPTLSFAAAGINSTITLQGKVVNTDGTNVTDGVKDFVFKAYNGAAAASTNTFTETWTAAALFSSTMTSAPGLAGESLTYSGNTNESSFKVGQVLWNVTKRESVVITTVDTATNVLGISPTFQAWANGDTITNGIYVKDGIFRVALNSLNQNWGTIDFGDDSIFIGINFNADGEMKPRIRFSAVPYAVTAENALNLGGITAAGYLRSNTSDTYESGNTLTVAGDIDMNGQVSIADTDIALDGATTNLTATGDFSINTNDIVITKASGNVGIGDTTPDSALDVVGDVYVSGGLSLFETAVSDGTVEATKFCTGDGETNCITDFAAISGGSNIWTDGGTYTYPTNGEVLGNAASAGANKIAGLYLADSAPLTFGTDNDITATFAGTELAVTQGNNDINFDANTLFIDGSANNVGLGTTNPLAKLTVFGGEGSYSAPNFGPSNYGAIHIPTITSDTMNAITFGVPSGGAQAGIYVKQENATGTNMYLATSNSYVTGPQARVAILNSGNVGIGTTGPDAKLDSLSTTEQLRLTYTDGSVYSSFTTDSSGNLTIDNTGTKTVIADDLQITGNDLLDSGATSRLTLGATTTLTNTTTTLSGTTSLTASSLATFTTATSLSLAGATTLTFTADNATINGSDVASGDLTLQGTSDATRTTSYVNLQPNGGNVGIGTTAPGAALHVLGTAAPLSIFERSGNANAAFQFKNGAGTINFGLDGSNNFGIGPNLDLASNPYMYIVQSSGNVGVGTIGPDAKIDSLSATEQLRLTYTDGTVYSAHTVDSSGNLTIDNTGTKTVIADDLQITGDDLIMGTNTSGMLLIADGTNFNPTAVSGDITINSTGVTAIGADKVTEAMLKAVNGPTDELCLSYESTTGDFEWQACGSGGTTYTASNGLTLATADFQLGGALTQNTTITQDTAESLSFVNAGTANTIFNLSSSGDLVIQDNGVAFATFTDAGVFTLDSLNLDGTTLGLTTDTDLLSLAANALTVNGSLTATSLYTKDTDASHTLNLRWNENDSANRILDFILGGGNRSFTINENFTIGDGSAGSLTYSAPSNLVVEADSWLNQDLTTDATTTFAGVNADAVNIGVTTTNTIDTDSGNLVLGTTTDIGSATTGLRVDTAGALSDIDSTIVSIADSATVSGNLTMGGQLQLGRFSATPTTAVGIGTQIFNTTTNTFQCYNGTSWYNCGGTLYSNSNTISSGSYLTVTHDLSTNDLLSSAWINAQGTWKALDASYQPAIAWEGKDTQKGVYHNQINAYVPQTETDVASLNLSDGLLYDTFEDGTKSDTATITSSFVRDLMDPGATNLVTLNQRLQSGRVGLMGGQIFSTATTDNDGQTYLGGSAIADLFYYDRAKDSTPEVLVELGIDPNWYNGVTLSVATSSATYSQSGTLADKNPNLTPTYNGSLIKATGTDTTPRTIFITIKTPTTFDWTNYQGDAATGVTMTPGTAQTLGTTGVSVTFSPANYNVGDVFKIHSWFIEAEGTTRGARQSFPERSYVVSTASSVDIIDADTQKLWMRFSQGTGYLLNADSGYDPTSAYALNGAIYVASGGSTGNGLSHLNFYNDVGSKTSTGGFYLPNQFGLSGRNTDLTYSLINASLSTLSSVTNDVAAAVIPNQPTQEMTVTGWGYMQGNDTGTAFEVPRFPYRFNNPPQVNIAINGSSATAPTSLETCNSASGASGTALVPSASSVTTQQFTARLSSNSTTAFASSTYYCYSWSAIGIVSPKQFVVAATGATSADGGTTIINETNGTKADIVVGSQTANPVWQKKLAIAGNSLYVDRSDSVANTTLLLSYYGLHNTYSESAYAEYNRGFYQVGVGAAGWSAYGPVIYGSATGTNQITSLVATPYTSTTNSAGNTIYVGTAEGVSVIQENPSGGAAGDSKTEYSGSSKLYRSNLITEEMVGDARGMWPLASNGIINMTDYSIKANTLTNNGTVDVIAGVRTYGASFNGSTQYLSCTDAACGGTTKLDPGSGAWSVGAWVKTSATGTQAIINKGSASGQYAYLLSLGPVTAGVPSFRLYNTINTYYLQAEGTTAINDNLWHQVVGTYDGITTISLYVDGVLQTTSTTKTGTQVTDSTSDFTIGGRAAGTLLFTGSIDEPFVTATSIPAAKIKDMYQIGSRALQSDSSSLGGPGTNRNQKLGGTSTLTSVIGDIGIDYANQYMYVGTNSTTLGALSKIQLNSDTNIKTYRASANANTPAMGPNLIDEDVNGVAVGETLYAVSSAASGVMSMGVDDNATATSGNYISKSFVLPKNIGSAVLWVSPVIDGSDVSNTLVVKASNDGGSTYATCTLVGTDSNPTTPEREYACTFAAADNDLKVKLEFARGSTKTNTYVTQYGISWLGEMGFRVEQSDDNNVRLYNFSGESQELRLNVTGASSNMLANPWTDGGNYLYATNYESLRVYDAGGTNYLGLSHDGTLANLTYNGTTMLSIDSSGNVLPNTNDAQNLGSDTKRFKDLYLGGDTLHIGTSTTDEGTMSYNTSTNILGIGTDATTNGDIAFFTDDLYLDKSTSHVGVGTTSPEGRLHITGIGGAYPATSGSTPTGLNLRIQPSGSAAVLDMGANSSGLGGWLQSTNRTDLSTNYPLLLNPNGGLVGIGTTGPDARLDSLSTSEQLRLTYTDGTVYSAHTVDSSGNLTIDNTGTKTVVADDLQVTGNDILDSGATTRLTLGATTTLTNTTTTLSGTTALAATSLISLTTAASVNWAGATALTFTADNATINGADVADGDLTLQGTSNATRTTSYVNLQPTSGNVGIGTTTPLTKLHVAGGHIFGTTRFGTYGTAGASRWTKFATIAITSAYSNPQAEFLIQSRFGEATLYVEVASGATYNAVSSAQFVVANNWGNGIAATDFKVGRVDTGSQLNYDIWVATGVYSNLFFQTRKYSDYGGLPNITYYDATYSGTDGADDPVATGYDATIAVSDAWNNAGNVTFGDASTDTVTSNANSWTFANDTNFVLSGGVNGLSFDTDVLSIDATNNRVGIGTTGPDARLDSLSTGEQLRLTYTDGSVYSSFTTDSSGNLTIDNTGTKTVVADDLQVTGNDILDSGAATRLTLGATTTLTNTTTTLSGTTSLTASSLATFTTAASLSLAGAKTLTFTSDDATINGSDVADGDLTLQGTSDATRTTSYVNLQPNGGNVGIGTTGPTRQLQVYGAGQTTANITDAGNMGGTLGVQSSDGSVGSGGAVVFGAGTDMFAGIKGLYSDGTSYGRGDLAFSLRTNSADTNLSEKMRITSVGYLGIGTTGPDARLDSLSTGEQLRLTYTDGSVYSSFTTDSSGNLTIDNTGTKTVIADDLQITGNDLLDSGATSRLTLGATTTLTNTTTTLSGTTSLTASSLATFTTATSLSLAGATTLTFTADNATINGSDVASGDLTLQGTSDATRTTSYVNLQPNGGNVGIGTTAPGSALHVEVNAASSPSTIPSGTWAAQILNEVDASTSHGLIVANRWAASASTAFLVGGLLDGGDGFDTFMKIDGAGNVGINTTAPLADLDVGTNASGAISSAMVLSNLNSATNTGVGILFKMTESGAGTTVNYGGLSAQITNGATVEGRLALRASVAGTLTNIITINDGQELNVAGQIRFDLDGTTDTTIGVCKNTADSAGVQSDTEFTDCNGSASDIAEFYRSEANLRPGDVVAISDQYVTPTLTAATTAYQPNSLGVVATYPVGQFGKPLGTDAVKPGETAAAIGLAGKVPVRINLENGPIMPGDPLTTSSTRGVAMRATKPGRIIGYALEAYTGSTVLSAGVIEQEQFRAKSTTKFNLDPISPTTPGEGKILLFINPGYLDPSLTLTSTGDVQLQGNSKTSFAVTTPTGGISTIAAFADAVIARIKAGFIETEMITAGTAVIENLTVEEATFETVTTEVINAPIITELTTVTASLSGEVAGVSTRMQYLEGQLANTASTPDPASISAQISMIETKVMDLSLQTEASISAILSLLKGEQASASAAERVTNDLNLDVESIFISDFLSVLGDTILTNLEVTNTLAIGNWKLKIENSLLKIGDLMTLDATGSLVTVNGNLTVTGVLSAPIIDELASKSAALDIRTTALEEKVGTASAVLGLMQLDVETATASVTLNGVELVASASAGTTTIPEGYSHILLTNQKITEKTLIYLTPLSSTENKTLYVKVQDTGMAYIGFDTPVTNNVTFNWWLVESK